MNKFKSAMWCCLCRCGCPDPSSSNVSACCLPWKYCSTMLSVWRPLYWASLNSQLFTKARTMWVISLSWFELYCRHARTCLHHSSLLSPSESKLNRRRISRLSTWVGFSKSFSIWSSDLLLLCYDSVTSSTGCLSLIVRHFLRLSSLKLIDCPSLQNCLMKLNVSFCGNLEFINRFYFKKPNVSLWASLNCFYVERLYLSALPELGHFRSWNGIPLESLNTFERSMKASLSCY